MNKQSLHSSGIKHIGLLSDSKSNIKLSRTILGLRGLLGIVIICIHGLLLPVHAKSHNEQSPDEANTKLAVAIHGGAGTILKKNMTDDMEQRFRATLDEALDIVYSQLTAGHSGVDAVTKGIVYLENSPLFNAGKGAVFTFEGKHELDASIMHGRNRSAGAIASVTRIKNPILAARLVMEKSEHVMLSGIGAEEFAASHELEFVDNRYFNTDFRKKALERAKSKILSLSALSEQDSVSFDPLLVDYKFGTVGVVVLDANGDLVAGTSTGGMTAKRFGRVGDSPIIGAGTFADNDSCAVSATGHGEYFIRFNVASDICARVKYQGVSLEKAANDVLFNVLNADAGSGGVIAIDSEGNIAMPFNTAGMYRASIDTNGVRTVAIYKDE